MFVKKWIIGVILSLVLIIAGMQIFMFSAINNNSRNPDEQYFSMSRQTVKVFQPFIPDSLTFCGEKVPTDHLIVRERLEREIMANMYWHSHTILLLKRSGRFFPIIEPLLKSNGVHDDIKFLAMCESELTNAASPAGAKGFWQFLQKTGLEYGLEITSQVDERNNLEKATIAACKYIKASLSRFGTYSMAAASYNMGSGGLQQKVTEQKSNDYYSLFLNEETSRYVYRILALKLIYDHPLTYGFFIRNKDIYQPVKIKYVSVSASIPDLAVWAKENEVSYLELRYLNPWLISNSLTVSSGKSYQIALPISMSYSKSLDEIDEPYTIFQDSVRVE
ncbi:MAG: hypothetical protein A2W93_08510 [Bacteroidetes bacterium GWF2_43_63]|nr:MAG: hypothetical protein A2W94_14840 [Bacteroidetes bacterium GWE2_42_42]OFY55892.1 MAG: hypothetical protein A2W93_08510 [Bacteroidetes bacterium GWF2_43_63]HCB63503.1 murein transglycosylase [Bacteroidales bacterium]HCY22911.1 murein transglycosylase [Bacteroidales bacterium]